MMFGLVIGATVAMACGLSSTVLEIRDRRKTWRTATRLFYITAMMCGIGVGITSYLR